MNCRMNIWVLLIAVVWMSVSVTLLEGVQNVSIRHPQGNDQTTRWAILVAGSKGYQNYRHQADVCHAYQILKRGGLKDENIIVFMYDDIAFNEKNPRPGVIINKPNGPDVYNGVPQDYTGDEVNSDNFFGVLIGDETCITGGSGKVLHSGPNDDVFIYYSDHGAPGYLAMAGGGRIYSKDLVQVLKNLHSMSSYKSMVIYLEACRSGSMFDGILPNDINVYATTAANPFEPSYATYCSEDDGVCLGDQYSVSWMEDCDQNDTTKETLEDQYKLVSQKTPKSHVMQYGDMSIANNSLATYFGENHDSVNLSNTGNDNVNSSKVLSTPRTLVNCDYHLFYLNHQLKRATNSGDKLKAKKELDIEIAHRTHVDRSVHLIGNILFGEEKSSSMMAYVRPQGEPLVDDWNCLKTFVETYESYCGPLSTYGNQYTRGFANMCNANISEREIVAASSQACPMFTKKKNHNLVRRKSGLCSPYLKM